LPYGGTTTGTTRHFVGYPRRIKACIALPGAGRAV